MQPRIVFVTMFPDAADVARDMAPSGFELAVVPAKSAEYLEAMRDAEYLVGFVDGLVDDALFEAGPNLKLIQLLSAGYDQADLSAARRAGVPLCNNGGANSTAVSEHAILLALAASRQLVRQHRTVAAGNWRGNSTPRLHEMRNRTLGIVGLGTIGKKTARLALAFGMEVIYYDIERLPEDREDALNVRFRLLRELLREADIVSEANYLQRTDWTIFFWICPARITGHVSGCRMGTEAPVSDVFAGRAGGDRQQCRRPEHAAWAPSGPTPRTRSWRRRSRTW